jgi:thiol-disulfide isomerase/thioredoxin
MIKKAFLSFMLAAIALCGCNASGSKETNKAEKSDATTEATQQASADQAPDFTLNDINGRPLSLSSLKGKYVVLDFWGSWCVWCIRGIPSMKEYYAKYAGKFEILGIDCNDTPEKWKAAVKEYELPWLHVYCDETSTVLADYKIQGFPTKVVVGPDGHIIKTIVGEDPAFYDFLDELFK